MMKNKSLVREEGREQGVEFEDDALGVVNVWAE